MLSFTNSYENMDENFQNEVFNKLKDEKESGKIGYYSLVENDELIEKIENFANLNPLIKDKKIS